MVNPLGSPPHMRGKVFDCSFNIISTRITPAHAGKRRSECLRGLKSGDHPRTCGEKAVKAYNLNPHTGSPPHMRGKEWRNISPYSLKGITPAHAGKSRTFLYFRQAYQDHPRTCGEKIDSVIDLGSIKGSPPHMRGKAMKGGEKMEKYRITPAHAGKRNRNTKSAYGRQDHPRTCGEKYLFTVIQCKK